MDLTLAAAVRICSSIITKCSINISHKSNSHSVILLGRSTIICLEPSKPTFCSVDRQPFRQIPLSAHQSNHPSLSGPQTPCNPVASPQTTPLSVPHLRSPFHANRSQYFRSDCLALQLTSLYCKIRCHCEKHGNKYKSKRPFS